LKKNPKKIGLVVLIIGVIITFFSLLYGFLINWSGSAGGGFALIGVIFWLVIGIIIAIPGLIYLVRSSE
jgi:hypothetical protein